MNRKSYDGYFTLEAAMVMPIVLLFTTTMIFVAFFMYDRSMLEHCAYEAALRGSGSLLEDNDAAYQQTLEAAISLIENKIYAAGEVSYHITVTGSRVEVTYECSVNVPLLSWLRQYVSEPGFSIKASGSAPRVRAVETIRLMDRAAQRTGKEKD